MKSFSFFLPERMTSPQIFAQRNTVYLGDAAFTWQLSSQRLFTTTSLFLSRGRRTDIIKFKDDLETQSQKS